MPIRTHKMPEDLDNLSVSQTGMGSGTGADWARTGVRSILWRFPKKTMRSGRYT